MAALLPKFETKQRDERVMLQHLMTSDLTEFEKLDQDAKPRLMSKIFRVEDLFDPKTNTLSCYIPASSSPETVLQAYSHLAYLLDIAKRYKYKITTLIIESDFLKYVSKEDLKYILDYSTSIKNISFGPNIYDNIDRDKMKMVFQFMDECPNLDTIYFERVNRNKLIKLEIFKCILRSKKLERLSLGLDDFRTDDEFIEFCNVFAVIPTLRVLNLNIRNLNIFLRNKKCSSVFFQALMNLKNLSALDLSEPTYKSGFEIDSKDHDEFESRMGPQLTALAKHPKIDQLKFTAFPVHHAEAFFRIIGNNRIIQFLNRKDERNNTLKDNGGVDFLQKYCVPSIAQSVKPQDKGDVKSQREDSTLQIHDTSLLDPYSNMNLIYRCGALEQEINRARAELEKERIEWEEEDKGEKEEKGEKGEKRDFEPGDSKSKPKAT